VEVLCLMLETFQHAGVDNVFLDIGHVGIYRGLAAQAKLDDSQEASLFEMLQRKAIPEITAFLASLDVDDNMRDMLATLAELHGGRECLQRAWTVFDKAAAPVKQALDYLQQTVDKLQQRKADVNIHFDLSELRGYHYHTGILFAAYVQGQGQEIARGGRYDDIGKVFGRARPATGFSTDLKTLVDLSVKQQPKPASSAIFAPCSDDAGLAMMIAVLRAQGETVIEELPGQSGDASALGCDRLLLQRDGQWLVEGIA